MHDDKPRGSQRSAPVLCLLLGLVGVAFGLLGWALLPAWAFSLAKSYARAAMASDDDGAGATLSEIEDAELCMDSSPHDHNRGVPPVPGPPRGPPRPVPLHPGPAADTGQRGAAASTDTPAAAPDSDDDDSHRANRWPVLEVQEHGRRFLERVQGPPLPTLPGADSPAAAASSSQGAPNLIPPDGRGTYFSSAGCTQIDYIFTRQSSASLQAKYAYPDHGFPVGGDRLSGHYPLRASLPLRSFCRSPPQDSQPAAAPINLPALQEAVHSATPKACAMQIRVARRLQQVDVTNLVSAHKQINCILLEEAAAAFPRQFYETQVMQAEQAAQRGDQRRGRPPSFEPGEVLSQAICTHLQPGSAAQLDEVVARLLLETQCTRFQKQAFDGVTRAHIYQSMQARGVPPDVITLVQQLHHRAQYIYCSGSQHGFTTTSNGIKQGCVIAPYLWNYFSLLFLSRLTAQRDEEWIRRVLTLFADDVWGAWVIRSELDLEQAVLDVSLILETLESLDMTINYTKTAILLRLVGRDASRLRRHHTYMKAGRLYLRVWVNGRECGIPIKEQHEYLGTIVTYRHRHQRNMQHRLQACASRYQGLRKLLNGSHHLTEQHRLRLWQACLTHVTTGDVWSRAGVPPGWTVQHTQQQFLAKLVYRESHAPDITTAPAAIAHVQGQADSLAATLLEAAEDLAKAPQAPPTVSCPFCQEVFVTENAMRVHCGIQHKSVCRHASSVTDSSGAGLILSLTLRPEPAAALEVKAMMFTDLHDYHLNDEAEIFANCWQGRYRTRCCTLREMSAMDAPRQKRTLREEDLDWISSQLYLTRVQLSGLAERLEAMQQSQNRMAGCIRVLEARAQRADQERKTNQHNKCYLVIPAAIQLEALDD
ncbi:unnamed protein product [Symbiodinium microadriaticum]|nr:unnamed protein product [Symbiodinium microadriaticum]